MEQGFLERGGMSWGPASWQRVRSTFLCNTERLQAENWWGVVSRNGLNKPQTIILGWAQIHTPRWGDSGCPALASGEGAGGVLPPSEGHKPAAVGGPGRAAAVRGARAARLRLFHYPNCVSANPAAALGRGRDTGLGINNSPPGNKTSSLKTYQRPAWHLLPGIGVGKVPGRGRGGAGVSGLPHGQSWGDASAPLRQGPLPLTASSPGSCPLTSQHLSTMGIIFPFLAL